MATTKPTAAKSEKKVAAKPAVKKSDSASKSPKAAKENAYTKPELREKLKEEVKSGEKGGRAGQWSARKAQLLAAKYEKAGGGYKKGGPTSAQKHLQSWTEEKWQTADGKQAARGKTTARYLPAKAWDKLSSEEKKATDDKKKAASRTGKQFVSNTAPAKRARKSATKA